MDLRKLQRVIVDALDDIKAQDIQVFNTTDQTDLFDRVIVATATSNRQTRALAAHVRDKVKAAGGQVIAVEGEETGEWVLVDVGDAVIHIMQPAIRAYYRLEELWGAKPVSLKVGPDAKPSAKRKPAVKRETAAASQTAPAPKSRRASTTPPTSKAASAPKATRKQKAASAESLPAASRPAASPSAAAKPRARKAAAPSAAKAPGARTARPAASPARKRTPSG